MSGNRPKVGSDFGITLGAWWFRVQGDLDTAVLVGGAEGRGDVERVVVEVSVDTDATPEQFARSTSETERRLPVTHVFHRLSPVRERAPLLGDLGEPGPSRSSRR